MRTVESKRELKLSDEQRIEILAQLRGARALVLRDSESFHEASTTLEHIGQVIGGEIKKGLNGYEEAMVWLAKQCHKLDFDEAGFRRLFHVVREARNTAIHDGAYARHLNSRLVDLLLILEEGTMANMREVGDVMVRSPLVAQPWHQLAQVRREMLANSFSYLPVRLEINGTPTWRIVSDSAIVRYLGKASGEARRVLLAKAVRLAMNGDDGLKLEEPHVCKSDKPIADLVTELNGQMILVVNQESNPEQLLGIITPFDLL